MDAFKKWDSKVGRCVECNTNCLQCKGAEAAWRAALEWALNELRNDCISMSERIDAINDELS